MRRVTQLAAALLVAMMALSGTPAWAEHDRATDPNDVAGKLDISRLSYRKPANGSPLRIVVTTYGRWGNRVLRDNVNRLVVLIDVNHDGTRDYWARIRKVGSHLIVVIKGSGSAFEPLPATRPTRRSVRFVIPGGSPPNPNGPAPDLAVRSRFIESAACDPASGGSACVDRAPDHGWL